MKYADSFINQRKKIYGFIDEGGNFGFDFEKEGVSSYFIITAILVDQNELETLEKEIGKIRSKYFPEAEMNSSSIGEDYGKRQLILEDLKGLNFKIFTVAADKKKMLQNGGLKYEKSYIKYLNGLLYEELHNYFPSLQLIADEQGNKEFMGEFKKYILKEHIPNLLGEYEFGFSSSKSEILIQLADFICGTIALGYENEAAADYFRNYMNILKDKLLPVVVWPYEVDEYIKKLDKYRGGAFDRNIAYNSVKLAAKYVENNSKSRDPEVQERLYVIKYLLSMVILQKTDEYSSSRELINNLREITGRDYTPHYFKTRIIAKLRDAGVLISSSQSGYKIPVREKEILAFVNQTSSMVKPMLERLKICRNRVLSATGNEFDVLEFKEYEYLKMFLDEEKLV